VSKATQAYSLYVKLLRMCQATVFIKLHNCRKLLCRAEKDLKLCVGLRKAQASVFSKTTACVRLKLVQLQLLSQYYSIRIKLFLLCKITALCKAAACSYGYRLCVRAYAYIKLHLMSLLAESGNTLGYICGGNTYILTLK
jgi:hypothetical protein